MIKGINKQILEVTNPESPYFEKIIFFVTPKGLAADEKTLKKEAEKISKSAKKPPKSRKTPREALFTAMYILLGIGAGAAISAALGLFSI